jgi:hypothetical protein
VELNGGTKVAGEQIVNAFSSANSPINLSAVEAVMYIGRIG